MFGDCTDRLRIKVGLELRQPSRSGIDTGKANQRNLYRRLVRSRSDYVANLSACSPRPLDPARAGRRAVCSSVSSTGNVPVRHVCMRAESNACSGPHVRTQNVVIAAFGGTLGSHRDRDYGRPLGRSAVALTIPERALSTAIVVSRLSEFSRHSIGVAAVVISRRRWRVVRLRVGRR
ncbi:MAG: hypothetical protein QOD72_1445 [Acidimicrobiaceae bacterium]|jgi:hypothetical protein|nr:hypothetical protein [Acidimicrobiaceae bacterium]